MPQDFGNLPTGVTTYGPFEYICFLDSFFTDAWMTAADAGGMGLCYGLIATAFATRLCFTPLALYSQMTGHKMKLLGPDVDEMTAASKRYSK